MTVMMYNIIWEEKNNLGIFTFSCDSYHANIWFSVDISDDTGTYMLEIFKQEYIQNFIWKNNISQ